MPISQTNNVKYLCYLTENYKSYHTYEGKGEDWKSLIDFNTL